MARITKNERYDEFGKPIKRFPDWWTVFGEDVQTHDGKLYYRGAKIVEITNYEPSRFFEFDLDPMTIQWSLRMADGSYALYKPESRAIAKALYDSKLWWRNQW